MLQIGIAPCTPYDVTLELMKSSAKLARSYKGVRLHTHAGENQVPMTLKSQPLRLGLCPGPCAGSPCSALGSHPPPPTSTLR